MVQVGILSDTHLSAINDRFQKQCSTAFSGCDIIIHAGDLVDISILQAFRGKTVHAVHGNTCNRSTRLSLPQEKIVYIQGYQIAITHGTGPRYNIEDRVYAMYPEADCIVFGHSHIPVCHECGGTLMVNPGTFASTGRHGSPGSYGLLQVGKNGLQAAIHLFGDI